MNTMKVCSPSRVAHNGSGYDLSHKEAGQMFEHSGKSGANAQSLNRPAQDGGSITFKGGFIRSVKNNGLATAIAQNNHFKKMIEFVDKKEATFSAFVNLGLLTALKPMLTLAMPAAEGRDKVSVASKEIVGGLVAFGLANVLTWPIEVGIIKISDNPAKYITNNQTLLKKFQNSDFKKTFTTIYKNSPEMVNACLKGALTVALMPPVIALIDKIRSKKAPPKPVKLEDLVISEKLSPISSISTLSTKGVI